MDDTQAPKAQDTVEVTLGERAVHVPAGGLFDRYRMQADLDEVAKDPRVAVVEFFRNQPKTEVFRRHGQPVQSENALLCCGAPTTSSSTARTRSWT